MLYDSIKNNPPQPYSTQTPGPVPEICLPVIEKKEGIRVWLDRKECVSPAILQDGTLCLPMDELSPLLGLDMTGYTDAREVRDAVQDTLIWWDKPADKVIITTGEGQREDILRMIDGKLYMNGKPYYEISFNKFDLKWQLCADLFPHNEFRLPDQFAKGEDALRQLHDLGFTSIRIFDNILSGPETWFDLERRADYFKACDRMYDLCDKYGIQIVSCLALPTELFCRYIKDEDGKYISDGSTGMDLICDPDCPARQNMYEYIDAYVGRYKNRRTILVWEIVNEGNLDADIGDQIKRLTYSAAQLGNFYADCAARIRQNDPDRLVTGGDGLLRGAQWHLYKSVMDGAPVDWTKDTPEERLKIYWLIHHAMDLISVHGYAVGYPDDAMCRYDRGDGELATITWEMLMNEAKALGKVLYNGETYDAGRDFDGSVYRNDHPARVPIRDRYLTEIINAGVQLTHWWSFHSDREGFQDDRDWNVCREHQPGTLDVIAAANKRIKAVHVINHLV